MDVEDQDQVEEVKEGEIDSREYDYLLSMALWSLTEERVDDLIRQMNSKKNEHDTLEKMHIY
jgi:DNA topoisomerase II